MPVAADLPTAWKVPAQEVRSNYALEGSVGQDLERQFGRVVNHWQSRPGYAMDLLSLNDDSINHVPFKKVGVIKVHFRKARPMRPRTIEIEDQNAE